MLIDSHCHILSTEYDDVNKVIQEITKSNILMIINGYDVSSSIEAVELAKKYKNVYASVGIGPENVDEITDTDIRKISDLLCNPKVVAIGEIGLDYYWTKENKEKQIKVFKEMLALAKNSNLPVIVHSRDSIQDVFNLLNSYGVTGILHCYSGSLEMAKEFIKKGFLIGIGGVVTFKNAKKIKEVVKEIPLSSISIETDSPYLTPEPYRGKKNESTKLKYIVQEIASIKGVSLDEVESVTTSNVMSKFDL